MTALLPIREAVCSGPPGLIRMIAGLLIVIVVGITAASALAQVSRAQPEAATPLGARTLARAERFMVSAANPLAVKAGYDVLANGGSAIDAAIAVQLVLNLVEPQSSGIGGGAFIVHWNAATRELTTYDGRETAPQAATPERFMVDGRRMSFQTAVHSGLSIGVPGLVRLLAHVHAKHGRRPWADLFAPAIALSETGFEISPRLAFLTGWMGAERFGPEARRYFFNPQGQAKPAGERLVNLAFAATLREIAEQGGNAFYQGRIAGAIVDAARNAPNHAGDMTLDDLAGYTVVERPAVCQDYRGYNVCGMGPPSSGALTVAQTLALLAPFDLGSAPGHAMNTRALHLIAEAQKLAYADRNRYIGDPDHVRVPETLLEAAYMAERSGLIDPRRAARRAEPGRPPGVNDQAFGRDATVEGVGTSHISIVDAEGNAVSMTTTIESAFGSRVMAAGFLLNNELTDFSFRPTAADGRPIANAVAPGKRPRSSMAPTLVFGPDGELFAVVGSPGGSRIILYVTKALIAMIDWGMDAQSAIELPNFGSRGRAFELELEPALTSGRWERLFSARPTVWYGINLKPFGHTLRFDLMTSGLHAVVRRNGRLEGAADPRREGVALGR